MGRFFTKLFVIHFIQWLTLAPAFANMENPPTPAAPAAQSCESLCNGKYLDFDKKVTEQCGDLSEKESKDCKSCIDANFTALPSIPYCESLAATKAANTADWITAIAYTGATIACTLACVPYTSVAGEPACRAAQLAVPLVEVGAKMAFGPSGLDGIDKEFKNGLARNEKEITSGSSLLSAFSGLILMKSGPATTVAVEGGKEGAKQTSKATRALSCAWAAVFAFVATTKYVALGTIKDMETQACNKIKEQNYQTNQEKFQSGALACRPIKAPRQMTAPTFEYEEPEDNSIVLAGDSWSQFGKLKKKTMSFLKSNPPETLGMEKVLNLDPIRERINAGMSPSDIMEEAMPGAGKISEIAASDPNIKAFAEKLAGFGGDPSIKYSNAGGGAAKSSGDKNTDMDLSSLMNQFMPKKPAEENNSGVSGTAFGSKKDLEDAQKLGIHTDTKRDLFEIIARRIKIVGSTDRVLTLDPALKQNRTAAKK